MKFASPLSRGRLVKRYKRFLADIVLDSGEAITASCPNTGAMLGLSAPGMAVWVSSNDNPARKYRHTLELVECPCEGAAATLVGINTGLPNRIVNEAIEAGTIPALSGYATRRNEVKYGINSRIDILLEDAFKPVCYVEVKNVHLMRKQGLAEFPDSVTERGTKHLGELSSMVKQGHRAVMVYMVQRSDTHRFSLAADIDPTYAASFLHAREAGVETLVCRCSVNQSEIFIETLIEMV